jgi:hypothetical protein
MMSGKVGCNIFWHAAMVTRDPVMTPQVVVGRTADGWQKTANIFCVTCKLFLCQKCTLLHIAQKMFAVLCQPSAVLQPPKGVASSPDCVGCPEQ